MSIFNQAGLIRSIVPEIIRHWFTMLSCLVTGLASISTSANTPSNAELALLGTAMGDSRGEQHYRAQSERSPTFTDDTHKAAAIFAFFTNRNSKRKEVDLVKLARYQCFAEFPANHRFGLNISGPTNVNLPGYGPDHARLLKVFFRQFQKNQLTTADEVLRLSASSVCLSGSRHTGSWSNGGCMGIVPIVALLDRTPELSDQQFVNRVRETVQVSHNHPHAIAAAIAIALAARSCIENRQRNIGDRLPDRAFAQATIQRIRENVRDSNFLACLNIVERNLGNSDHAGVMNMLNQQLPVSTTDRRGRIRVDRRLRDTWAPSTAAAVLHFLFSETDSQQSLLRLVGEHTHDQDTVGAMLTALSVLREGGFRQSEFSTDELQGLLDLFPAWVNINREARDYLVPVLPAGQSCHCMDMATE